MTQQTTTIASHAKQLEEEIMARHPLQKGKTVSHYTIKSLLGAGGFSLVYLAYDNVRQQEVTLKEFYPKVDVKRSEDLSLFVSKGKSELMFRAGLSQFFQEAKTLCAVDHPNVVKATNVFRANKTAYIVSEASVGRDLKWFLKNTQKPLEPELLLRIFMPIVSGLAKLHHNGYLHLDLKPANILLRPNKGSLLLDFGAVQNIGSVERASNFQTLTHGFAPPEQYYKALNLGAWTDIYALGATMYHALTCKIPEKAKHRKTEAFIDAQQFPALSKGTINAINKALLHDSKTRYQDVQAFAKELLADTRWSSLKHYEEDVLGMKQYKQLDSMIVLTA